MKQRITGMVLLSLAAVGLAPIIARAATPGIRVTTTGAPYRWNNDRSIVYNLDLGRLGNLTARQAAELVLSAFEEWSKIETAQLTFEEGDPLERDVDGTNVLEFMDGVPSDVNPIIYDQDGSVIETLFGNGASLTVPTVSSILQETPTGRIAQGRIIINGRMLDGQFNPDDLRLEEMKRAIVRAIGLMLNVGASDLNDELVYDGSLTNNTAIPVMSPTTVIGGGATPTLDDRMAVSMLYPSTSFEASTGVIRGQVVLPDGSTGLQGIAVIAHKADDPVNSAVSAITGTTYRNSLIRYGSADPILRGTFEMRVPPGDYVIEFRPLRQAIGPRGQIFPLPGGAQYYQAAPTAGPADPTNATPLTVTAGQTVEIKITTGGTAAPAPQTLAETEPNDSVFQAPLLPLSAAVSGNIDANDPGQVVLFSGGGLRDDVEDLYRLSLTEPSIVILQLQPEQRVDLDLYVFGGFLGGANPDTFGFSFFDGNEPEVLQLSLEPGTYYVGITAWDNATSTAPSAYTLSVTTTPVPRATSPSTPILDQLVIGNITATGAEVRWITDRDATADAVVATPALLQFGDPALARTHLVPVTGLQAGTIGNVTAVSQVPGEDLDRFRRVFFRTADQTAVEGPPRLNAYVLDKMEDFIGDEAPVQSTWLVAVAIQNTGGNAANVQLTELQAASGWRLATPITTPISVGTIDSGGTAVVVVRLLREGTDPRPPATVTGSGTLTGADGAAQNFTIGGP